MLLVARAHALTSAQLHVLRACLPALARVDVDELELALGLLPVCTLEWVAPERGTEIVAALAEEGLALELMDWHEFLRALVDPPPVDDGVVELVLAPAFHPPSVLRASESRGLEAWHFVEDIRLDQPLRELLGRIELEQLLRAPKLVSAEAELDPTTLAGLRDTCERVREAGDVLPDPSLSRDGVSFMFTLLDSPMLRVTATNPEHDDAPRLLAAVDRLLGLALPLLPELAHLSRYFEPAPRPRSPRRRRK